MITTGVIHTNSVNCAGSLAAARADTEQAVGTPGQLAPARRLSRYALQPRRVQSRAQPQGEGTLEVTQPPPCTRQMALQRTRLPVPLRRQQRCPLLRTQ